MEKDLDVQALNEATRDTFLGSQKVPMSNIVRRFENSKTKNDCIQEDAVGSLFGAQCGNAGMDSAAEMCDAMVTYYTNAYANCDDVKGANIVRMQELRCNKMTRSLERLSVTSRSYRK